MCRPRIRSEGLGQRVLPGVVPPHPLLPTQLHHMPPPLLNINTPLLHNAGPSASASASALDAGHCSLMHSTMTTDRPA